MRIILFSIFLLLYFNFVNSLSELENKNEKSQVNKEKNINSASNINENSTSSNKSKHIKRKEYIIDNSKLGEDKELTNVGGKYFMPVTKSKLKMKKIKRPSIWPITNDSDPNINAPDTSDKETVLQFSIMSRNAYIPYDSNDWIEINKYGWDFIIPYGWSSDENENTSNRIRGYFFGNSKEKIMVMAIKGTSAGIFGIGGPTSERDKFNDNMMFSCCCASVDRSWKRICDCSEKFNNFNICNLGCVNDASQNYSVSYFEQGKKVYESIKELNPGYSIWFTGHSLGGALASLLALHYKSVAVTFEAPGEALFATKLELIEPNKSIFGISPVKKEYTEFPIYQFGNSGDPIFLGRCTGITSACYYSGFAMESKCHLGQTFTFILNKNNNPDDEDPGNGDGDEPGNEDPGNGDGNEPGNEDPGNGDGDEPGNEKNSKKIKKEEKKINNNQIKNSSTLTNTNQKKSTSQHSISSPVFLVNKSSLYDNYQQEKRDSHMKENNNDNDEKNNFSKRDSPAKLNMFYHRIDYVVKLISIWKDEWPSPEDQADCIDCSNWQFVKGE